MSNTLTIYAQNIEMFFLFRSLCAISHGIFWAIVTDFAMKIVHEKHRAMTSSIVFSSIPLATVMGIPTLNYIGQRTRWDTAFLLISILIAICLIFIFICLPKNHHSQIPLTNTPLSHSRKKWSWLLIGITAMIATAQSCAYTYIEPYIRSLAFFSQQNLTLLLIIYGLSGLIGNVITMRFMPHHIKNLTRVFLVLFSITMLSLYILATQISFYSFALLLFFWGVSASILFTTVQTWVILITQQYSSTMAAFNSAILNYAIALGATFSAWLVSNIGLTSIFIASASILLVAIVQLQFMIVKNEDNRSL
nr:MFS transporter [Acinetobacter boissieri]